MNNFIKIGYVLGSVLANICFSNCEASQAIPQHQAQLKYEFGSTTPNFIPSILPYQENLEVNMEFSLGLSYDNPDFKPIITLIQSTLGMAPTDPTEKTELYLSVIQKPAGTLQWKPHLAFPSLYSLGGQTYNWLEYRPQTSITFYYENGGAINTISQNFTCQHPGGKLRHSSYTDGRLVRHDLGEVSPDTGDLDPTIQGVSSFIAVYHTKIDQLTAKKNRNAVNSVTVQYPRDIYGIIAVYSGADLALFRSIQGQVSADGWPLIAQIDELASTLENIR